jgi:hypothetical protein
MTTRTFQFTVSSGGAPSWFTAIDHRQWGTPVSNTLYSVIDPKGEVQPPNGNLGQSPTSIITAWTGAVCDQSLKTIALMSNGGHQDYLGNEVYSVDLSSATPAWIRRRNASQSRVNDGINYPANTDGRPTSDHTGDYNVAANGKWFKCGQGACNFNGGVFENYWWTFSPTTNDYTFLGSSYPINPPHPIASSVCYDAARNQIIKVMPDVATGVRVYSAVTGAEVTSASFNFTDETSLTSAFDSTNDVLLVMSTNTSSANRYYALRRSTMTVTEFTGAPVTGTRHIDKTAKMHWHAPSNAFITWDGAQGLVKFTPVVSGGTYTGGAWAPVSGLGGVTLPSNMLSGLGSSAMYSKVQLINDMGNGNAALVIVPRYVAAPSKDVFVMRLTGGV